MDSSPEKSFLPYGRQSIDEADIAAVADVLRGDYLTTGPSVQQFEEAICAYTGARHCIAVGNGTHALHLACLAAGLGDGDWAIVPSITFVATANAVRYCGAEVIFCDVDPVTGLMRPEDLLRSLENNSDKTIKAVLPVHLTGLSVELDKIKEIASSRGITVIADACHALGGAYKDKPTGGCYWEDMSVFSFHPVKSITTGEGGAITTNCDQSAARMRTWRSHGLVRDNQPFPWAYEMAEVGYNYRLTDIQCALGVSQLSKLDSFVSKRNTLAGHYQRLLQDLSPQIQTPLVPAAHRHAWHLYAARLYLKEDFLSKKQLVESLRQRGIGTQVHYIPVHTQPYYSQRYGEKNLPGADAYYHATLSLPLFPDMDLRDVERVHSAFSDILKAA